MFVVQIFCVGSLVRKAQKVGSMSKKKPERVASSAKAPATRFMFSVGVAPRVQKKFEITEIFGIDLGFETSDDVKKKQKKQRKKKYFVEGFAEPTKWTPTIDSGYVFPVDDTKALLLGMLMRDRILITGHSGCGKTSLVEQVAARLNYNVIKINFDGEITRPDLVGTYVVRDGTMTFQYGIFPEALRLPGTIILLDEWDTISKECAFVLQRPLQKDDGNLLIMETGGELIPLHPDNVIVATANTQGQGDESGLYAGANVQNFSQLNRFGTTLNLQYMPAEQEKTMLINKIAGLTPAEANGFINSVTVIREAYVQGELSVPVTPRDLLNWAEKYIKVGDPIRAAKYAFLNRMNQEDHLVASQCVQRSWSGG